MTKRGLNADVFGKALTLATRTGSRVEAAEMRILRLIRGVKAETSEKC